MKIIGSCELVPVAIRGDTHLESIFVCLFIYLITLPHFKMGLTRKYKKCAF